MQIDGREAAEIRERVPEIIEKVGLSEYINEDINGGKIKSAFHSIPPIARWLIAIAAVMAALLTIVLLAARRRREDPSDQ